MAIDVAAVAAYTKNRLAVDDPETQRILDRATSVVEDFCEWHVKPIKANHVITLDGPGGRKLPLPTQKVDQLHSVVEDGIALNVAELVRSQTKPVLLEKKSGACWSTNPSSIVVTMTHGYAEDEAMAYDMAVLDACDRFSQMVGTVNVNGLKRYDVDDIKREWFDPRSSEIHSVVINERLLRPYRLIEAL